MNKVDALHKPIYENSRGGGAVEGLEVENARSCPARVLRDAEEAEEKDRQRRLPLYAAMIEALENDTEDALHEAAERYYAAVRSSAFADGVNREFAEIRDSWALHRQKEQREGRDD